MCGCNLVTPRLIGGGPRSSSGSLAMLAAMRLASSQVRLIARRGVRRGDYVGNRGSAEVRDLRWQRC